MCLDWNPPIELLPPLLSGLERLLKLPLERLRASLQGCLGLVLTLHFAGGERRAVMLRFMQPTLDLEKLLLRLQQELTLLNWPDAVSSIEMTLETGELPVRQLSLFASAEEASQGVAEFAALLKTRHGGIFYRGMVAEESHPVPERRSRSVLLP